MKAEKYIKHALEHGAKRAVYVELEQIAFDSRSYLKCIFGCEGSRQETLCHSQPGRIKPWEYEEILKKYSWGVLILTSDVRSAQALSLSIERLAVCDGYYFAFSLSDCDLCDECNRSLGKPCSHYCDVRPSMHGAGIDVFKTAKGLGLPLFTLQDINDELNCYSLVLVE